MGAPGLCYLHGLDTTKRSPWPPYGRTTTGWLLLALLLLLAYQPARAQDSLIVQLPEKTQRLTPTQLRPFMQFLVDTAGRYTLAELTGEKRVAWRDTPPAWLEGESTFLWSKTVFHNLTDHPRLEYLVLSPVAHATWAFIVRESEAPELLTGRALQSVPGVNAALPLYLAPDERVTVYYRGQFSRRTPMASFSFMVLTSAEAIFAKRVQLYSRIYLYLGVLLTFLFLAGLLFYIYPRPAIVYFGVLLVGFGGYFYNSHELTGIGILEIGHEGGSTTPFTLLILLGLSGFLYHYLELRRRFPRLYRYYLLAAIIVILLHVYLIVTGGSGGLLDNVQNASILVWAVATLAMAVAAARRGGRAERNLLVVLAILFVLSLVFLMNLMLGITSRDVRPFFLFGTLALAGLIGFVIYDKLTTDIREIERMTEQRRFRTRFFANITHEFRTPLTLILGPLQDLLERAKEPADQELLTIANRNARRQLELVNHILDLSRSEATQQVLDASPTDLVPLLRRITATYESYAAERAVSLAFVTELPTLIVEADAPKLETVLFNLLTNAFKFTPAGGRITVQLYAEKQTACITVRDTGHGIVATALPFVFDRFYTENEHAEGDSDATGIGLALSRELVVLHGGTIEVSSKLGAGTEFCIALPYRPGLVIARSISVTEAFPKATAATPIDAVNSGKSPLVLIVEDNADMRTYIGMGLQEQYQVRSAPDGRAGLELARQLAPDLIISDVMMPRMSGFELCHALKTDLDTSHIPIILLTARSASRDRLHGLDTGADDYLVKPFDARELLARVRNLIASRRLLRERFSASLSLKPEEVTATSVDRDFLTTALRITEEHLTDETFSVDRFAQLMTMSRTSLNRKFRALLGQSTNQFIRSVKLERAADLLLKTDEPVVVVGERSGFGSPAYFVKSFREKFGVTPGAYRKGERGAGTQVQA